MGKDGQILSAEPKLEKANRMQMRDESVLLANRQRSLAAEAILLESKELNQKIFGLAVCANHVHLAVSNISLPIGRVVSHYKHAIRLALQNEGFVGRLWTAGFDKRYCMNERELAEKIRYIQHQQW